MKKPTQLLEVDDPGSKILISHWEARRSTQVLVTSEHKLSLRMVRNYFKGFGEIEECVHQPLYVLGDYRIIVTFKQADGTSIFICKYKYPSCILYHLSTFSGKCV